MLRNKHVFEYALQLLQISGDRMEEEQKNDKNDGEKSEEILEEKDPFDDAKKPQKKRKFKLWEKPLPQSGKKYSKSFRIALSGISCAMAVIFLALGYFSDILIATGFVIAEIALMIPLSKQFILGDFLAYLGTVILVLLFGAIARFWSLLPFIIFFGLHPLVNYLQVKYSVNKWLALVVKMIWFDVMLYVTYLVVFGGVLGASAGESALFEIVNNYIWVFIIVFGSIFLLVYDRFMFKMQIFVNRMVYKVKK